MNSIPRLAIGELFVGDAPASILGLGSCMAIALFDPRVRLYGLAHCLLPERGEGAPPSRLPAKFIDDAIPALLAQLEARGARRSGMMAKLAGGATMFPVLGREVRPHIGERNIETAHRILRASGIPLAVEDVGGGEGRSVTADPARCELRITTLRGGARVI